MRTITIEGLPSLQAEDLGSSRWLAIEQGRIDTFADATDDHQYIHTDPERAAAGPFGATIAHGYLTLSLLIPLWEDLLEVADAETKVNYGLERVRFPSPTKVGSRVRLRASMAEVTPVPGGAQIVVDAVIEAEGVDKPVCVARPVFRYYT